MTNVSFTIGVIVVLSNVVLSNIAIFYFSFYKASKAIIKDIIKIKRSFLWDGMENEKKIDWVRWDIIFFPKKDEGLGIKYCGCFNLALLCKWKWSILAL